MRELLDSDESPYTDFNEFVVAAVENQLQLVSSVQSDPEEISRGAVAPPRSAPEPVDMLLPVSAHDVETVEPSLAKNALFMLTNRMNPFPLPLRVLVNMTKAGGPPTIDEFAAVAGAAARKVGLDLQRRDAEFGPGPRGRRAVGWPVSDEPWKSQERFTTSFLLRQRQNGHVGPLLSLGLCNVRHDRVFPTDRGLALAIMPNPILGEVEGEGLSREQQDLLRDALRDSGFEMVEICLFIAGLRGANGDVTTAEATLARAHKEWNSAQISAHRAAMVGRLVDVGALQISGRGRTAKAALTPEGEQLIPTQQKERGEAS